MIDPTKAYDRNNTSLFCDKKKETDLLGQVFAFFYLSVVISDISRLPAGCTLNCIIVSILVHVDDLVRLAPTAEALKFLLNALTSKFYTL